MEQNQTLNRIANQLDCIPVDQLSTAEEQICRILQESSIMTRDEIRTVAEEVTNRQFGYSKLKVIDLDDKSCQLMATSRNAKVYVAFSINAKGVGHWQVKQWGFDVDQESMNGILRGAQEL